MRIEKSETIWKMSRSWVLEHMGYSIVGMVIWLLLCFSDLGSFSCNMPCVLVVTSPALELGQKVNVWYGMFGR